MQYIQVFETYPHNHNNLLDTYPNILIFKFMKIWRFNMHQQLIVIFALNTIVQLKRETLKGRLACPKLLQGVHLTHSPKGLHNKHSFPIQWRASLSLTKKHPTKESHNKHPSPIQLRASSQSKHTHTPILQLF